MARRAAGAVGTMAAAAAHTDRREDAHGRRSGRHERSHDPQRSSAFGTLRCMLAKSLCILAFFPQNETPDKLYPQLSCGEICEEKSTPRATVVKSSQVS